MTRVAGHVGYLLGEKLSLTASIVAVRPGKVKMDGTGGRRTRSLWPAGYDPPLRRKGTTDDQSRTDLGDHGRAAAGRRPPGVPLGEKGPPRYPTENGSGRSGPPGRRTASRGFPGWESGTRPPGGPARCRR